MYNPVSYSGLALVLRAGVERSERGEDAPRISASRGARRDASVEGRNLVRGGGAGHRGDRRQREE